MWMTKPSYDFAKLEQYIMPYEGIIQTMDFAELAAPIVPVIKTDSSIRICGDYKVTVNQAVKKA